MVGTAPKNILADMPRLLRSQTETKDSGMLFFCLIMLLLMFLDTFDFQPPLLSLIHFAPKELLWTTDIPCTVFVDKIFTEVSLDLYLIQFSQLFFLYLKRESGDCFLIYSLTLLFAFSQRFFLFLSILAIRSRFVFLISFFSMNYFPI